MRLFERMLTGGAAAAGLGAWGLRAGARADLLVIDASDPALAERGADSLLDTLVFSSPTRPFVGVMVAGRWRVGG
jgi:formimidoylglutamate deiminase